MKYTVKPNDTLGQIAEDNNTTVKILKDINMGLTENIKPGQEIRLPFALFRPKVAPLPKAEPMNIERPVTKVPPAPAAKKAPALVPDRTETPLKSEEATEERPPTKAEMPAFEDFVADLNLIEEKNGLPENLLAVLAFLESSGNPAATGSGEAGAKGMFQATPIFLQNAKLKNPYDLVRIPRAAAAYLAHAKNSLSRAKNIDAFEGFGWDKEWELAMMAYHAGVQGVLNWLNAGAPLDGNHKNVGRKTLTYAEKVADHMLNGANAQLIEPAWRRYTNT